MKTALARSLLIRCPKIKHTAVGMYGNGRNVPSRSSSSERALALFYPYLSSTLLPDCSNSLPPCAAAGTWLAAFPC
ncbi:MAG TPA: hypothetical protein VF528_02415 [Pyrinomonadaceae bacterium]